MEFVKCDRCGAEISHNCEMYFKTNGNKYHVCYGCYREWVDNGYWDICHALYCAGGCDLADKFMLDYLGKLG